MKWHGSLILYTKMYSSAKFVFVQRNSFWHLSHVLWLWITVLISADFRRKTEKNRDLKNWNKRKKNRKWRKSCCIKVLEFAIWQQVIWVFNTTPKYSSKPVQASCSSYRLLYSCVAFHTEIRLIDKSAKLEGMMVLTILLCWHWRCEQRPQLSRYPLGKSSGTLNG